MDDSCAVCADNLEWVAYGACGHKEVCSTCVARLRFICDDRRCCICKTECDFVFITKALGDYTKNIGDFSVFPSQVKEGRVGSYWYHEDTQAFFDDLDHYKMIKAMCKLSCSVCDKMEEPPNDGSRRRTRFRNIEQLKGHLFHHHRLVMCSLCLEGRKVFICEQKLYTRAQLNQHINTGDSEVDGSESERGGFAGHPICEFCTTPFYGDNELYTHMSTEHYTCHICQRQHPGQYEYYKNYDDLENHFRRNHFLCEDESCLAKKFTVFSSEAELKRHNTLEHGGRMSRSQRNAALQIPTSFRYRRYNEQENRRGRGRTFRRDTSDTELSMAIQASLETAIPDQDVSSSRARVTSDPPETSDADPLISPFESLATTDPDTPERYLQALSQNSRNARIEESSFPPLPAAPSGSQQRSQPGGSLKNSMASHLRRQSNRTVNVLNSCTALPAANRTAAPPVVTSQPAWPALSNASGSAPSTRQTKPAINNGSALPSYSSSIQARQALVSESSAAASVGLRNWGGTRSIAHSASAPNLVETGSFGSSTSDFPPVSAVQARKSSDFPPISAVQARKPSDFPPISAVQSRKPSGSGQNAINADVQTANKSLVERIRDALNFDEDKYTSFKNISGEFRQGLMDAETYLVYVQQFGLSHLVLELAGLCPDPQKKKELEDVYNANLTQENGWKNGIVLKDGKSKKGKGKSFDTGSGTSKDDSVDNFLSNVRKLQSGHKLSEEDVEVLPKDGYRSSKGKSKLVFGEAKAEVSSHGEALKLKGQNDSLSAVGGSSQMVGDGDGKSKQRKKTSKFHRLRLGNDSTEATLNLKNPNSDPDPDPDLKDSGVASNAAEGLPVRGVWRSGGGQRLVAKTSKGPKK